MADVKTEFNTLDISDTNGAVTTRTDSGRVRLDVSAKIRGGTDDTQIGNVGDRLKIDGTAVPSQNYAYITNRALNGGSDSMNVNGSVTPVDFEIAVPSGQTWYLDSLSFLIIDTGSTSPTNFGALSALTNGCLLINKIGGVEYNICNLKDNKDITLIFQGGGGSPSGSSWLESTDSYYGELVLNSKVSLNGTNGDKVIFRVRDNLVGIDNLNMIGRFFRVL